jgi:hypothetical protein
VVQAVPRRGRGLQPGGSLHGWQYHSVPASLYWQEGPHALGVQETQAQRPSGYVQSSLSGHVSDPPASRVAGHSAGLPLHEEAGGSTPHVPPEHSARVVQ